MESPSLTVTLSRSPSTTSSPFAPGSCGRRSHTNIPHLSLAPLTPKYPIDPSDYDAYIDPSTSKLHTSASFSHLSSLSHSSHHHEHHPPLPGGILSSASASASASAAASPAHSRANSRSRLNGKQRKTKSVVSIRALKKGDAETSSDGAVSTRKQILQQHQNTKILQQADSSWLVQTGLALTEGSRESKGQSWIVKRDSSTSLHTFEDYYKPRSLSVGRMTSQQQQQLLQQQKSRSRSRSLIRRSRKGLSMTPADVVTPGVEDVEPDWADSSTQAEIAAQVAREMAGDYVRDGYAVLDFEGNLERDGGDIDDGEGGEEDEEEEEVDEDEVRAVIQQGKSWFDGVIDVFLKLEDDPSEDDSESARGGSEFVSDVEAPPDAPKGLWDDVAWFGRLLGRTIRS